MPGERKLLYILTPTERTKLERKKTYFTKPSLVAYFERDYENVFPAKRINYLALPKPSQYPIDLNVGASDYIFEVKPEQYKSSLLCLEYIMSPKTPQNALNDIEKTKVYTRGGVLNVIMRTPYYSNGKDDNWIIAVTRYGGNLFLLHRKTKPNCSLDVLTHHGYLNKLVFSGNLLSFTKNTTINF